MTVISSSSPDILDSSAPHVSRHGFYCVLAFVIWTVLLRLVLPFGDEPDFTVRAVELVEEEDYPPWAPYNWLRWLLDPIDVKSFCKQDASPIAIFGQIDSITCSEPLEQIVFRIVLTVICCSPLLWVVVYRSSLHKMLDVLGLHLKAKELNQRLDALGASLLIPGMIYYLGLLSHEQFSLAISLLISVVWGSWLLVILFAVYTAALDIGNGAIIFAFLVMYAIVFNVWKFFGSKGLIIFLLGALVVFFIGSYDLLSYVQVITLLSDKAESIYRKSLNADYLDKYPAILRPVITYITAIFMTPSGIKAVPAQLMFAFVSIVGINRLLKNFRKKSGPTYDFLSKSDLELFDLGATQILPMIAALTTILGFSLMLPDYANAKYYMFLVPFILLPFMSVFGRLPRLLFMNASCAIVLVFLGFQYV